MSDPLLSDDGLRDALQHEWPAPSAREMGSAERSMRLPPHRCCRRCRARCADRNSKDRDRK